MLPSTTSPGRKASCGASPCVRACRGLQCYHTLLSPWVEVAQGKRSQIPRSTLLLTAACVALVVAATYAGAFLFSDVVYFQLHEAVVAVSSVLGTSSTRAAQCGQWPSHGSEAAVGALVSSPGAGAPSAKPRIAVLTLYSGRAWEWAGRLSDANKAAYCAKHGYTCVSGNDLVDPSRPAAWSKLLAIKHFLPDFDWVFYMDSDTFVMNASVGLEAFLDRRYDFIATNDGNGFNSGVMLVRNTAWSLQWLQDLWDQDQLVSGKGLPFLYEQRAFHALLSADPASEAAHVKYLPPCAFNSQLRKSPWDASQYNDGDFVLHFAGYHGLTKEVMLCRYAGVLHTTWCPFPPELLADVPGRVVPYCSAAFGEHSHLLGPQR